MTWIKRITFTGRWLLAREANAYTSWFVCAAAEAQRFFETRFRPFRVAPEGKQGFLTGYYEPLVAGSLAETEAFRWPILARPRDLEVIGEYARLLRRPPAGGEHDEGDDRIERVVGQHLRERPGCELLRAHPGRGDGDAEAGQRAGDDARR